MHLPEFVKKHPVLSGLGLVAAVYLVYRIWAGSGSAPASSGSYLGLNQAEVQAAAQLQAAQLQQQTQLAEINAQAGAVNAQTAGQVQVATLQAQTQQNNDNVSASASEVLAGLQAQTQQVIGTLQAQVADTQTQAQVQETQINDNALVQVALAPYTNITIAQANELAGQINTTDTLLAQSLDALQTPINASVIQNTKTQVAALVPAQAA